MKLMIYKSFSHSNDQNFRADLLVGELHFLSHVSVAIFFIAQAHNALYCFGIC